MPKKIFHGGRIYRALSGQVYDIDNPKYDCYLSVDNTDASPLLCLVCDDDGNRHPGYTTPVPVLASVIGDAVGDYHSN